MATRSVEECLRRAKRAFTTRRVPVSEMTKLVEAAPKPGDLVLARVDALGKHKHLENLDGRRAHLFEQDEILVCYGNRYAPDQFEAVVGPDLGPCHLVAGGGIASTALSWHSRIAQPTSITPLGLVADVDGQPLNIGSYALTRSPWVGDVPTLAVFGTAMNAGKTTTAAALVRGMSQYGHKVGTLKITGTGSGGDLWWMKDSGASEVLDFVDAGYASTYMVSVADLERIVRLLIGRLTAQGCTAIVAEIADGLYQRETNVLLGNALFRSLFPQVIFTAYDAMGASTGTVQLTGAGFDVVALSGKLCCSPLAQREAQAATGIECVPPARLSTPEVATGFLPDLMRAAVSS